ncbi:hypothetical protein PAMP_022477 [Pampus punctatissimus]
MTSLVKQLKDCKRATFIAAVCLCQDATRPNIVMVMSDAFDGRLTFDPGSKVVQLPYINYLRELGTTFLNAYTNSPICCPSRAAMWSGQFVHLTQSWNNYKCLDANATTWMDILEKNGYHTKMMGKLDYTSGSHSVSNRVEAWTRDVQFLLRQEGRPVTQLVGNMSTERIKKVDWKNTDMATQWIHQRAASPHQPFALYLGLNLPHTYKTESLGPTAGGSTFLTSPYWLKKACFFFLYFLNILSTSCCRITFSFYFSLTLCILHSQISPDLILVPKWLPMAAMHPILLCQVISALRETSLLNNTVVIFTADHGELAMEHRQFYKMSMFEGSSHVPLLIMGPGLMSGLQVNQLVSLVDLYPTVLDIAGISAVGNLSGHSLLPLLSKSNTFSLRKHPDWILSEYHGCNVNASTYMLRSGQWKYITYADGQSVHPQLFDLTLDTEELHNVVLKFPDVRLHLDKLLRSIVDYPKVSTTVHIYNKKAFGAWRQSLGRNYSQVIANLRWHVDWQKDVLANERAIDRWLYGAL